MGKIPTSAEYMAQVATLSTKAADVYRYMSFDKIPEFTDVANEVQV